MAECALPSSHRPPTWVRLVAICRLSAMLAVLTSAPCSMDVGMGRDAVATALKHGKVARHARRSRHQPPPATKHGCHASSRLQNPSPLPPPPPSHIHKE